MYCLSYSSCLSDQRLVVCQYQMGTTMKRKWNLKGNKMPPFVLSSQTFASCLSSYFFQWSMSSWISTTYTWLSPASYLTQYRSVWFQSWQPSSTLERFEKCQWSMSELLDRKLLERKNNYLLCFFFKLKKRET